MLLLLICFEMKVWCPQTFNNSCHFLQQFPLVNSFPLPAFYFVLGVFFCQFISSSSSFLCFCFCLPGPLLLKPASYLLFDTFVQPCAGLPALSMPPTLSLPFLSGDRFPPPFYILCPHPSLRSFYSLPSACCHYMLFTLFFVCFTVHC